MRRTILLQRVAIAVLTISLLAVMGQSYHQTKDIRSLKQKCEDARLEIGRVNQLLGWSQNMEEDMGHRVAERNEELDRDTFYIYWLENRMSLHMTKGTPAAWRYRAEETRKSLEQERKRPQ